MCTVDGQCFSYGDAKARFPMTTTVKPFLYALALNDCGVKEVEGHLGNEPTSHDPAGFGMIENKDGRTTPMPYNAFMDT